MAELDAGEEMLGITFQLHRRVQNQRQRLSVEMCEESCGD